MLNEAFEVVRDDDDDLRMMRRMRMTMRRMRLLCLWNLLLVGCLDLLRLVVNGNHSSYCYYSNL